MALDLLPEADTRRAHAAGRLGLALAWSTGSDEAARACAEAADTLAKAEGDDAAADYLAEADGSAMAPTRARRGTWRPGVWLSSVHAATRPGRRSPGWMHFAATLKTRIMLAYRS